MRMTKTEMADRIEADDRIMSTLRRDVERLGAIAELGSELAARWVSDRPLDHRGGCQCHFCLLAQRIARYESGVLVNSERKMEFDGLCDHEPGECHCDREAHARTDINIALAAIEKGAT